MMSRAELEQLDRETLIKRAEEAGVVRARILTRPELVDELLVRSAADDATKERMRGFFGLARDLLARVVERGLHLPDAADRIRTLRAPPSSRRIVPTALPTVTLAEIYAAQGHRDRAVETLEGVLSREPDHAAARALLEQLQDATYPMPQPRMPPEKQEEASSEAESEPVRVPSSHGGRAFDVFDKQGASREPAHVLDDAPLPPRYDVDECVAIPVDPKTLYVYWEVRERTLGYVRASRPEGALGIRVVVVVPTWEGPDRASAIARRPLRWAIRSYAICPLAAWCARQSGGATATRSFRWRIRRRWRRRRIPRPRSWPMCWCAGRHMARRPSLRATPTRARSTAPWDASAAKLRARGEGGRSLPSRGPRAAARSG